MSREQFAGSHQSINFSFNPCLIIQLLTVPLLRSLPLPLTLSLSLAFAPYCKLSIQLSSIHIIRSSMIVRVNYYIENCKKKIQRIQRTHSTRTPCETKSKNETRTLIRIYIIFFKKMCLFFFLFLVFFCSIFFF